MEHTEAKRIMQDNFIGSEELSLIAPQMGITVPEKIPDIPFSPKTLRSIAKDCLLILGTAHTQQGYPLTLSAMREHVGWNSAQQEPCFYNQDWYLNEPFAKNVTLKHEWYLIKKIVNEESRGKHPLDFPLQSNEALPLAILTAYAFFAYYFLTNKQPLWKHDFLWCADKDSNGDQIYTGRYIDPNGINKNGFNVHRYLSLRPAYGIAPQFV